MRTIAVVALIALPAATAGAQFEAASIKERFEPATGSFVGRRPGGRFATENASLREILEYAYQLQKSQLVGSLAPLENARWDIVATFGSVDAGPDATLVAVRALLSERFGLAAHRETRTMPVYALRLARADGTPGPALVRSATDCVALIAAVRRSGGPPPPEAQRCGFRGKVGGLQSNGMPLSELALALSGRLERSVVDQTGLTGPWDLTLTYDPGSAQTPAGTLAPGAPAPAANPDAPSLFTALQEQLGLRLVPTTAPVDVLVVDRVSRPTQD
jgi:uncharacterized protein (TIGR03435 family)